MGPGRDRAKGIAAYESILQRGETTPSILVNLGEALRTRREFARTESLNVAAIRLSERNGTAYGNAIEMQLNQGKLKDAAALADKLYEISPRYAAFSKMRLSYASGDLRNVRRLSDSLLNAGGDARRRVGLSSARDLALLDGRLHAAAALLVEIRAANPGKWSDRPLYDAMIGVAVMGATPTEAARVDSTVDHIPFRELPMIDRPYLFSAALLARVGKPEKARAMLARYRSEMTDTSIVRVQADLFHGVLGEIALASGKPREALDEFRRSDIAFDGAPADECVPCLPFDLARAYDAAGKPDSAAMMFERYLSTPAWFKFDALSGSRATPGHSRATRPVVRGDGRHGEGDRELPARSSSCGRTPIRSCSRASPMRSGGSRGSRSRSNRVADPAGANFPQLQIELAHRRLVVRIPRRQLRLRPRARTRRS